MKKAIPAPTSEHTVNNVKYEVFSSFKPCKGEKESEDLADRVKHLILSEDIRPRKK